MVPLHRLRAKSMWTPAGVVRDGTVEVDDNGVIRAVRAGTVGDGPLLDGMLVPGLVNAHTHLELSWQRGRVAGGEGLLAWLDRSVALRRTRSGSDEISTADAARELAACGTAVVCDISNGGDTAPHLVEAGLAGSVQHELLTLDAGRLEGRLAQIAECGELVRGHGGPVFVRPTAHALYSSAPQLVQAVVDHVGLGARVPASLHVAESVEELEFLREGTGPFADLLDRLQLDWHWWKAPGSTPIAFLEALGVLRPRLLLVHGVHTTAEDRALLAKRRAPLCLCPRSNRHITGELPDVPALVAAGVTLCIGTDSLASNDDLDVLGEVRLLLECFPEVDPKHWLRAATSGGADALGIEGRGRLVSGTQPGVLLLEGVTEPAQLGQAIPSRRWLVRPGGAL